MKETIFHRDKNIKSKFSWVTKEYPVLFWCNSWTLTKSSLMLNKYSLRALLSINMIADIWTAWKMYWDHLLWYWLTLKGFRIRCPVLQKKISYWQRTSDQVRDWSFMTDQIHSTNLIPLPNLYNWNYCPLWACLLAVWVIIRDAVRWERFNIIYLTL